MPLAVGITACWSAVKAKSGPREPITSDNADTRPARKSQLGTTSKALLVVEESSKQQLGSLSASF